MLLEEIATYTVRRTNKSVIEEIISTNPLEALIKKQQLSWFGHIMPRENSLEKSIMLYWELVAVHEREADHDRAG